MIHVTNHHSTSSRSPGIVRSVAKQQPGVDDKTRRIELSCCGARGYPRSVSETGNTLVCELKGKDVSHGRRVSDSAAEQRSLPPDHSWCDAHRGGYRLALQSLVPAAATGFGVGLLLWGLLVEFRPSAPQR